MSIKPLDEILKKRVVEPFVYDNRNERFIGKTGKPIILSNNDSSESSLKIITQTITLSEDGSQIKNVTNDRGKRVSKLSKNGKEKEQQIANQILSEISYVDKERKEIEKQEKNDKKQERKQSYGEKERARKPASFKTQQIDFSNQKRDLYSNNNKSGQKKSEKIRRDGFVELESFNLDLSSIKKGNPNDMSEMNDLGDFLGFGAKKTKTVFQSQQNDIPTKQKPEQTNTQKDEQIRIFLQQGKNIYKKQPQLIVISSQSQQANKNSRSQQYQQQLSFNHIQPVRIKAQVINISQDSQSIPQNKNKKKGNNNKKKHVQKKSSQQIIFQSEIKNNGKRLKKQTVITISDSEIKIDANVVEIKTNNGVSIVHHKPMQEQKQQENKQKKIQQQKSFSFANSIKNGPVRQEQSKDNDHIYSLKRSRSQASFASQQERKQSIYEKRKREKKQQIQKKNKQQQLRNKKIEEQKRKRQNDKSCHEKSRQQIDQQKKKKQEQKKRIQKQKKKEQQRKNNQRKKLLKLKKKREQEEKKKQQKQRKRAQEQQKQRQQQQRRIQQSLIFEEDRKQRRQSLKNTKNQIRQESVKKTRSQTKGKLNQKTKKTKVTRQPKKKNPPRNKRNQSDSVETNKSKNNKTKKQQNKKDNTKKTITNHPQSASRTNALMSSVSSSKYQSSIDSFNSNSDQISNSSSLSDFSNNSLNTTTRGIGQRRAKNKVKRQKSQPPQTPKQQIKQPDDLTSLVQSFIGYNPSVAFNLINKKSNQLIIFAQMNTQGLLLQSMNGNYKQVKIQTLATTRNDIIQAFDRLSQKVLKKGKFWTFRNSQNFTLHSTKKSNTQTILRVTITF